MPANYVLLQRIELNASAASVTFSNIPQSGYTDLKVVVSARSNSTTSNTGQYDVLLYRINGTTTGYSTRKLLGNGASASSGTDTTGTSGGAGGTWGRAQDAGLVNNLATASTFSNIEYYIPNYTSSNYKSISIDSVTEQNATNAIAEIDAALWSNTAAITSISFATLVGTAFMQYSTFSLYGLAAVGTTPVIAPKATGGNITSDGTYWIHTFNSTGTFTPLQGLTCDYLVVAGGGGGSAGGAGGGAGGLRSTVTATGGGGSLESALTLSATNYTVTVGAGGNGGAGGAYNKGSNGTDSIFSTITATAGGAGGAGGTSTPANFNGNSGGSGGGGGWTGIATTPTGGAGTSNQGYAGGNGGANNVYYTGGGGGANAVGSAQSGSSGGAGGAGVATSISGSSVTYAGGGGGADVTGTTNNSATGGAGGGGNGSGTTNGAAGNGTANRGGGGGGGGYSGSARAGGNGGSGIVIIRYPIA